MSAFEPSGTLIKVAGAYSCFCKAWFLYVANNQLGIISQGGYWKYT